MASLDFDEVMRWNERHTADLPNIRFLLQDIGGLPKEEVDEIISKITPEQLVEIYGE